MTMRPNFAHACSTFLILLALSVQLPLAGCSTGTRTSERVALVEEFSAARKNGDYARANTYLAPNAKLWFDDQTEESGRVWKLGDGPWKGWDTCFNGKSQGSGWSENASSNTVWSDFVEMNDFYRLIEREAGPYRATYYFDSNNKISGRHIGGVPAESEAGKKLEKREDKMEEFKRWATEYAADEIAYLLPNNGIDPSGDRPQRMKKLLVEWRKDVGLPTIPLDN